MKNNESNSNLTLRIIIAMLLGVVIGISSYFIAQYESIHDNSLYQLWNNLFINGLIDIGGTVFIATLKVLVVPLVFVSLVCGVCAIGGNSRIGQISLKTLTLYCLTTALAISLALIMANLINPGLGFNSTVEASQFTLKESSGLKNVLIAIFPTNFIKAMAEGNMLQVILIAIFTGMALAKVGDQAKNIRTFFEELDVLIMKLVTMLMQLAPYGVFCLITGLFASSGPDNIFSLLKYFSTVLLTLFIHSIVIYGLLLLVISRLNPLPLFKKIPQLWLFGFSTASSNASIPVTLDFVENKLGVSNEVASFTVPLGATINMDGTAIMQGVATVFIAQYYYIDISLMGYLTVIATATLASIGTAGVPGVGLITLAMVLNQVGLPVEGISLIIGIDRLLDMVRTAVNITGDAVISVIVGKSEQCFDKAQYTSPHSRNDIATGEIPTNTNTNTVQPQPITPISSAKKLTA